MNKPAVRTMVMVLLCLSMTGCASVWVDNNGLVHKYGEKCIPNNEAANLVIWPVHLVALTGCYAVDQTLYLFKCIPPAGVDAADYFMLRGNGNNIMLERTIAVPKTLATPLIFAGSWLVRWIVPVKPGERVFKPD